MIREILKMGNPLLRETSRELDEKEFGSDWLRTLIQDMRETMESAGGIGLAAPQIGELVQVAIVDISEDNPRYDVEQSYPEEIIINPKIEYFDEELSSNWEGCLSVPGLRGLVERPARVRVRYRDVEGNHKEIDTDSFTAIVLQHELDHLFGVLYVDRIKDMHNFVFEDQFAKLMQDEE